MHRTAEHEQEWPSARPPDFGAPFVLPDATSADSTPTASSALSSGTAVSRSASVITTLAAMASAPCRRGGVCRDVCLERRKYDESIGHTARGSREDSRDERARARPGESAGKRAARGVLRMPSARSASAMPGASRSITARVASGVTSRGPRPVPPVVRITSTVPASAQARSSGTMRCDSSGTISCATIA